MIIDVIIPTIDDPSLLNRALQSIIDTCTISCLQIYIIDDCSDYLSTQYLKVINNFSSLSCHYYRLPKRSGPGPARNYGIKQGRGDYIVFLDVDDEFQDDIINYCDNNYDYILTETIDYDGKMSNGDAIFGSIHGLGIKRSLIEQYNHYFPEIKFGSEDMIFRVLTKALSNNYKIYKNHSFYKFNLRLNSNFLHRPVRNYLFREDYELLMQNNGVVWYSLFLQSLNNLNINQKIISTTNWSNTILSAVLKFRNFEEHNELSYILTAAIVKKYINLSLLSTLINNYNLRKTELMHLLFISKYFKLQEDDILTYIPDSSYKTFIEKYNNATFIRPEFTGLKKYYDIQNILLLHLKYYYQDHFIY